MSTIIGLLLIFVAFENVKSVQLMHDYRLDDSVKPSHYDLRLRPYFTEEVGKSAFTFDGNVKIVFRPTLANLQRIVLHTNQLTVDDDWLVYEEDFPVVVVPRLHHTYDEVTQKLTLNLMNYLAIDRNYVLEINFAGSMNNNMVGFYRSSYIANGVTHWLGATQFESTDARRAFPCFDEPRFKATFKVTIDRPSSYAPTLSNTYIENWVQLS
jgi:aminopeptidase N